MKNKKYKAVIFDIDGTLLNTTDGILAAVEYTIEKKGMPSLSKEQLLSFIGPPIQNSFKSHYKIEKTDELQELATIFRDRYKSYDLFKAEPYSGIYELCDFLYHDDIVIAVATYKRQDYAESILEHFNFTRYSNIVFGADHENRLTKKEIIIKCLDRIGLDYNDVVMIGDSENDAVGAQHAGVDFIGVTYGFGYKTGLEVLKCPAAVWSAKSPLELLNYFKNGDQL